MDIWFGRNLAEAQCFWILSAWRHGFRAAALMQRGLVSLRASSVYFEGTELFTAHVDDDKSKDKHGLLQEPQLDSWWCWPVWWIFLAIEKLWNYRCFEFILSLIKNKTKPKSPLTRQYMLHVELGLFTHSSWKATVFFYLPTYSWCFCDAAKCCNLGKS